MARTTLARRKSTTHSSRTVRRPSRGTRTRSASRSRQASARRPSRTSTRRPAARSTRRSTGRSARRSPARSSRQAGSTRGATRGQREIQRFLDGFVTEMTDGDGRAVATRFEYPALMVMSSVGDYGGAQLLQDEPTVSDFFDRAPDQYQAKGIHQTTALVEDVQWLSDDLALVRTTFPYLDEDGDDMGDSESSIYLLRKTGDDFRICCAVTLGAASDRAAERRPGRSVQQG